MRAPALMTAVAGDSVRVKGTLGVTVSAAVSRTPVVLCAPVTVYVLRIVGVMTLPTKLPPAGGLIVNVVAPVTLPMKLPKTSVATAVYVIRAPALMTAVAGESVSVNGMPGETESDAVSTALPFSPVTVHMPATVGVTALPASTPPEQVGMLKLVLEVTSPMALPKASVATAVYVMRAPALMDAVAGESVSVNGMAGVTESDAVSTALPFSPVTVHMPATVGVTAFATKTPPDAAGMENVVSAVTSPM